MGHYFPSASSTICTRCGYSGNTHTHSYTSTVVPPTCTQSGYTLHTCSCGASYQDSVTAPLGHSYSGSSTVCSRCGYSSHTHSYSTTVIAPTCTAGGYTQHTCSCGDSYQDSVTAALGHSYSGSSTVCSRCGYSGHTHSYTSTVVAPTCTEGGYTLHVCECGDRYEDTPTAARGHFFVTPTALVCTRCGYNRGTGTYSLNTYALTDSTVTEEYSYTYNGSSLTQMVLQTTQGSGTPVTTTLNFSYDASGMPLTVEYNGTMYYYVSNVQGDVVGILNSSGTKVVSYTYDAWGNILTTTGSMASTLGAYNPLRYRGYVYDTETGLYYLQSRYYDPELGRFINADDPSVIDGNDEHAIENNLFVYCFNNPVNLVDDSGYWPSWATKVLIGTAVIVAAAVLTVATAGTGTALACFALGALKGAALGAAMGAASGAATGAISHRVTTGSWEGAGQAALEGAADGYMTGAISGFVSGGLSSSACFVAGTRILASSGKVVIENIKAGDYVWANNPETGETALKQVVRTFVNETTELVHVFVNDEEIICTNEHPFYSPVRGWTAACKLCAGDILVTVNGEYVVVEKIQHEFLEHPIKVYNFEVEDFHTYYVTNSSILVHNLCVKEFVRSPKNAKQVLSYLKEQGFKVVSQNGSHIKLVQGSKTVIVPNHGGKDIAMGTLRSIMKQAGLL